VWAARVVEYRKRRELQKAAQLGLTLADSDTNIDDAFARVQSALSSAQGDTSSGVLSAGDAMDEVLGNIDRYIDDPTALAGPSTGWKGLDRLLDGYRPGGVTAIYAKTSSYKSTFVANSAHHLALNDVPVMLFTTETPTREIMERLLQIELMVNFRTLKYERRLYQIQSQIRDAAEIVRQYPIWICDQSAMDIGYVMGAVARQSTRRKLAVVVIDLIDHVSSKFLTRSETESERYVSQQVKAMAKREELHVVETTHVKKADRFVLGANRPYIDPEEVKGSTSKIQDADASISLMVVKETDTGYAPMERDEIVRQRHEEGQHLIYAAVTKNRHGEQGNVLFNVDLTRGGIMSEL
jgi:replicative DNA helicase